MQDNQVDIQRFKEDEVDLRELFKTLMKNKFKIIIITLIITVGAVIYAYTIPKVYEAKVILKVGEYKLDNDNKIVIADASELSKELEILFIDIFKNKKDRKAKIEKIGLFKQQQNFIKILALGSSNDVAISELNKIIYYVQNNHQKILDDVRETRETKAKHIEAKLSLLKTKTILALQERIKRYKKDIKIYEMNFFEVQNNLKNIKKIDPTLIAAQISEQRNLVDMLIKLKDSLEKFENQKNIIEVVQIKKFEEELIDLKVLMKPCNYKNTEVIGNIMINDYPVNSNKKLIAVVAFVTGLILSIFLVFFIEFLKSFRDKENY